MIIPEHVPKIMVFADQHRIVFERHIDQSDTRPHFNGISIRSIDNWQVFYQAMSEWAKEHHVTITIMN